MPLKEKFSVRVPLERSRMPQQEAPVRRKKGARRRHRPQPFWGFPGKGRAG